MRDRLLLGAAMLVALSLAGDALAQAAPPDAEHLRAAAEEFDAGRRAYKLKDYEEAAVHFENADRDAPNAEALRSAIKARKEAKQAAKAATLAALALSRYPNDKAIADYANQVLAAAEKSLHKVAIKCTPSCSLVLDGKVTPFPDTPAATLYVDAGAHTVVAGWSGGRNRSSAVTATAAGSSALAFDAPPEEPKAEPVAAPATTAPAAATAAPTASGEAPAAPPTTSGLPKGVFFVGAGVTLVLGAVTAWSAFDTKANPGADRVKSECAGLGESCPAYQDGLSRQHRTNALLIASGGVGVATAVIGAFFTDWSSQSPSQPATGRTVVPVLQLADGVGVGAVGRF